MSKRELRIQVIKRDGEKCFLCNCKTNLDLHHILFKRNGGKYSLSNCILLCWKCHHIKLHNNAETERYYTYLIINKKLNKDRN